MDKGDLVFAALSAMATFAAVAIIYLGSLSGSEEVKTVGWQMLIAWWLAPGAFWLLTMILQDKS
ncbi:hypothetical protein ABOONEI_2479 [Aciduliprofundum boonei T469]|nr:hypothetical protein ABOONEI_2479 [Aciduliprofundum boonei T469]